MRRKALVGTALGTAFALLSAAGVVSAGGDQPSQEEAQAIVAVVEQAAGPLLLPSADATVSTPGGTTSTIGGDEEIMVPSDASQPITITDGSSGASAVTISIPQIGGSGEATLDATGTSVFDGDQASLVVQPVEEGGVQAVVTLDNPTAPASFSFQVAAGQGSELVPSAPGRVDLVRADGSVAGAFVSPQAVDANGNPVATHLAIGPENEVLLVVDATATTAYPVVAPSMFIMVSLTDCVGAIKALMKAPQTARKWERRVVKLDQFVADQFGLSDNARLTSVANFLMNPRTQKTEAFITGAFIFAKDANRLIGACGAKPSSTTGPRSVGWETIEIQLAQD